MINKSELIKQAKMELARREFFYFCNVMAPDFYKEDRKYLVELCNDLQNFYYSDEEVLIINEPPRHGKTRTVCLFADWLFGININEKIITGSYNETLSTVMSKNVRNTIQETKADEEKIVYSDIFPNTKIKYGDGAMNLWSLDGGYNNYLATSPSGTVTGFGASLMIIDDLIKNAEEANNANTLDKHWEWFTNTMLSRLELGGKIIIIMTRWHSKDLAGRILKWCKENKKKYKHICMKAKQDDGTMLCDEILDNKAYEDKKTAIGADIFSANYQQEPIDIKGKLYSSIKTYDKLPIDNEGNLLFDGIYCYTDTADEGDDYLCSIIWGTYLKEAYILDLIYTKENMEITEPMVAKMINEYKPQKARIESNNGGRGFARNVRRILQEELGNYFTDITWFHQSKNKKSRILTNSTWIMNHIYFPQNWNIKYPDFFESINSYQKEGKNAHDDAEDALTGVSETMHMINN